MNRKIKILFAITAVMAVHLLNVPHSFAASGHMYLSPGNTTAYSGSYVTVSVRFNSGKAVNSVQANLTYPADKLDYISTSFAGSAFSIQAESSGGSGSIRIARGTNSTLTGDHLVGTVTFRSKTSSGSATISYAGGSTLVNNGASVPSTKTGSVINFTTPPPSPPPPVKDTKKPDISEINTEKITPSSAMITWKTNEKSDSLVQYGLNKKYGLSVGNKDQVKRHNIYLSSSFLLPKTMYHFRVISIDSSGNKSVSKDQTFTTTGIPYIVVVKDQDRRPVKDAKVTLGGQSLITDKNGKVVFEVSLGEKTVLVDKAGQSASSLLSVGAEEINQKNLIKEIKLGLSDSKNSDLNYIIIAGGVGLFAGYIFSQLLSVIKNPDRFSLFYFFNKKSTIANIQKRYGVKNAANNPYYSNKLRKLIDKLIKKLK